MKPELELRTADDRAVEIHRAGGGLLLRYVFRPDVPQDESPRPYAHPVNTLAGELLTNFRPNDHRWHHGLNFTINSVSGHNFWGGGTYRKADGYQMRGDHGSQHHVRWIEQDAGRLRHELEWRVQATGGRLLREERTLAFAVVSPQAWTLRWTARLRNVTTGPLHLGQYHSREGLIGSHYSGLQFRGARDLLDDHLDDTIDVFAEGGRVGEKAVHGAAARWMEWRGQKDTSLRRVRVHFENPAGPLHWFIRRNNPLAALPFQYADDLELAPGGALDIDHLLTFADA